MSSSLLISLIFYIVVARACAFYFAFIKLVAVVAILCDICLLNTLVIIVPRDSNTVPPPPTDSTNWPRTSTPLVNKSIPSLKLSLSNKER
jgi:hypothetical protein